jgi:3-methyladenine DNA glycosylase AlkD/uncharacterized protein YdhG (YjbR/CyaY superfamily)
MAKPTTIDAYLAGLPEDQRAALEKVRKAILAAAPQAEECFSYGLPAFRDEGGLLAGFGAGANHCAYYPMSGSIVSALGRELAGYATSKGAIRFDAAKPLPAALIRKLVRARQAENGASAAKAPRHSKKAAPLAKPSRKAAPLAKPSRKAAPLAKPSRKAASLAKPSRKAAPLAKPSATKAAPSRASQPPDVATVLAELERHGSSQFRADMSARYGIVTRDRAFGTPMAKTQQIAKKLGQNHALAAALWKTGVYEARLLASMVDEPERVTPAQMNRWAKDFDNWATVDTLCFNLFDRTPHAFTQAASWSKSRGEFIKRAAFALLASAALHGRGTAADFARALPLIERCADDERNFVKKSVSWALRAIGRKVSDPKVRAQARALAQRLAASDVPAARWIGKDALKEFAKHP